MHVLGVVSVLTGLSLLLVVISTVWAGAKAIRLWRHSPPENRRFRQYHP